eukprot:Seg3723.1 transcript_id=Seg3723.1/GoldUCD/mRNA.D3Y31 product="hypothetical protein" protein_id=Seg3723.1/GoldUCD/D3Y31
MIDLFLFHSILLEGGTSKPSSKSPSALNTPSKSHGTEGKTDESSTLIETTKPKSVSITLTPDEITKTKEFEERLRQALEQSRMLQNQQMNQIKNLENEISLANKDEGLGVIDAMGEKSSKIKKPRKLKGILKKPKQ